MEGRKIIMGMEINYFCDICKKKIKKEETNEVTINFAFGTNKKYYGSYILCDDCLKEKFEKLEFKK